MSKTFLMVGAAAVAMSAYGAPALAQDVEEDAEARQDLPRAAVRLAPVDEQAEALGLVAHDDVCGVRAQGNQVEFLVDGGEPSALRLARVRDMAFVSRDMNAAAVALVHTGQHFDHRGFARPVLADQRMYLTFGDIKAGLPQRGDAGEEFVDARHRNESRHGPALLKMVGGFGSAPPPPTGVDLNTLRRCDPPRWPW